jgi:spermidine/putrescine transport system substrate-binding protein
VSDNRDPQLEALLRGLAARRMSRRDVLRYAGAGVGLSAFLAACGVRGTAPQQTQSPPATQTGPGPTASPSPSPLPPKAGVLNVANWPLYIDRGRRNTRDIFQEETGIALTYKEDINDNDEFFGTDLRQQLSAGQATGWDIIVMTDWMIEKLIRLGWIQELHHDLVPNAVQNLDEKFRDPWYDPGNAHSFPWAAGITGIGYNPKLTGREVTSIADLWDPAFAGHVGMFSEMRDSINFALLLLGHDPVNATMDQVQQAVAKLQEQRDQGIVRAYYGNDYVDQLAGGNLWLTMAWSGDVFTLRQDNPDLRFVIPEEGGNRWVDNMAIPILAEHPTDAHEWINFVYRPEIAAKITEWVWYESPVNDDVIRDLIRQHAREFDDPSLKDLAEDTTVWPDATTLANTYPYKRLDEEEEQAWHDLFDPVAQG